mmetsp:Transcript_16581/g.28225  ORF Transcript_16581/g.28225 Transcript_16581/m.28225 type:complete len:127 (-) Transcript_16581:10-390(-)
MADIERLKIPYSLLKTEQMADKLGTMNQTVDWLLDEIYEKFPLRVENYDAGYMRVQLTKDFMRAFFSAPHNRHLLQEPSHKVGVVCHSFFLRCMSSSGFDVEQGKVVDSSDMKNCEILPCLNYKFE